MPLVQKKPSRLLLAWQLFTSFLRTGVNKIVRGFTRRPTFFQRAPVAAPSLEALSQRPEMKDVLTPEVIQAWHALRMRCLSGTDFLKMKWVHKDFEAGLQGKAYTVLNREFAEFIQKDPSILEDAHLQEKKARLELFIQEQAQHAKSAHFDPPSLYKKVKMMIQETLQKREEGLAKNQTLPSLHIPKDVQQRQEKMFQEGHHDLAHFPLQDYIDLYEKCLRQQVPLNTLAYYQKRPFMDTERTCREVFLRANTLRALHIYDTIQTFLHDLKIACPDPLEKKAVQSIKHIKDEPQPMVLSQEHVSQAMIEERKKAMAVNQKRQAAKIEKALSTRKAHKKGTPS